MSQLEHYGVKGMRWGKRKGKTSKAKLRKMSSAEIKALSDYLEIENRFRRLEAESISLDKRNNKPNLAYAAAEKIISGVIIAGISKGAVSAISNATKTAVSGLL